MRVLRVVDVDARRAAVAFLCAIEDACAERVVSVRGGHAIHDSRHPLLWDANRLRVEAPHPPGAGALDVVARRHFDALGFQMISVRHEAVGRALARGLQSLGYQPAHELLMCLAGEPRASSPVTISEVSREDLAPSRIAATVEHARFDVEVAHQLVSRDALIGAVVAERCFAVVLGRHEVVARCQLYAQGPVAQIENVYTAPAHRRRGFSRALVSHAAREARSAGAELVFLLAAAADWPQDFYRRAGFADVGVLPRFVRGGAGDWQTARGSRDAQ